MRANGLLRQVGTRNLVAATLAAGSGRLIAQSGAWLYADGPLPHVEGDQLRSLADFPDDPVLPGILELERLVTQTTGFDGVVSLEVGTRRMRTAAREEALAESLAYAREHLGQHDLPGARPRT